MGPYFKFLIKIIASLYFNLHTIVFYLNDKINNLNEYLHLLQKCFKINFEESLFLDIYAKLFYIIFFYALNI